MRSRATTPYTARDGASPATVAALCRGALLAQRARITKLQVDVHSDEPWPAEAVVAVQELDDLRVARQGRIARRLGWEPGIAVELDPRDDRELGLALAVAPYTICGTGYDASWRSIWNADDTGTSLWFELLPAELVLVLDHVEQHGDRPTDVVVADGGLGGASH
ncbi:hypothetical protein [Cellulosimicrobium sp. NPDC057127]|uniref:hypothetical protein n=1 Tax=Cellulosimicrobium sp. NPDC057127 TaxID=3346026 RepID=UPI00363F6066